MRASSYGAKAFSQHDQRNMRDRGVYTFRQTTSGLIGLIGHSGLNENARAHGEQQVIPLSYPACLQCRQRFGPLQCPF